MFYEIKIKFNQSPPPPPKLLIHPKTAATFWFISVAKGAAKVICARRSNSSRLNSSFFFFLWQGTGEEERQRPHTGEKPVGFTAGHPAAANTQHTQLQRRDVTRETFFQDEAYGVIDLVPCAGLTALAGWSISQSAHSFRRRTFQWKSMVIKLDRQSSVFLIFFCLVRQLFFMQCCSRDWSRCKSS